MLVSDGPLPEIPEREIRRVVGGGAFERGRAYQRQSQVSRLEWFPGDRRLQATVRGSGGNRYQCDVALLERPGGGLAVAENRCTCPVGRDCKHMAAALLHCNAGSAVRCATSSARPPASVPARPPAVPAWQRALARLTSGTPTAGFEPRHEWTPVGLQVRVDGLPKASDRSAAIRPGALSVSVRPVKQSAKGAWSGGYEVSWDAFRYHYAWQRLPMAPATRGWFRELSALRSGDGYSAYSSGSWLDLGTCSPFVWQHLTRAEQLGIPLVGSARRDVVRLVATANLTLDATTGTDGGIRLVPAVELDGRLDGAAVHGAIGTSGLFAWEDRGAERVLSLGPVAEPLTEEHLAVLDLPSLEIPDTDVPEFLTGFYPLLRRRVTVTSRDASVALPVPARPVLVVTADFVSPALVRLAWEWSYPVGGAETRLPVTPATEDLALRDAEAEATITSRVEDVVQALPGFAAFRLGSRHEFAGLAALDVAQSLLPALATVDGVRVEAGQVPGYVPLEQAPLVTVAAGDTGETDWFDLGITVSVDGREIPFEPLFRSLAAGLDRLLLDDGAWLRLDRPVFDELRRLIEEATRLSDRAGALRISRYQASLWADLEDVADVVEQSDAWRRSVGALNRLLRSAGDAPPTATLPAGLTAELRPYQRQGYEWLALCWEHGLGGVLADDMGLGKTVQALALIAHAREQAGDGTTTTPPFLVVAPASVVGNWSAEATRFTPGLRVLAMTETAARSGTSLTRLVADVDVVVTSYAIFRLEFEAFHDRDWSGLILDEAQFAKNHATKANECARMLRAPFKLAITGTPLENNLMELWAMLAITAPGLYPSRTRFREDVVRPVEAAARPGADDAVRRVAAATLTRLRRRLRPVLMRRTKGDVAPELPDRQEQVRYVPLAPRHRRVYDTHLQRERSRVLGLLEDFESNRIAIFRSLTMLRRLALDAGLVDDAYHEVPSSKLEALVEQLEEVVAEGHRALVFSQFTGYLALVAERCRRDGIRFEYLDGKTTHRTAVIDRFKDGGAPLFLISLKAGGFGLNLTEADHVFLLDPWWNPAVERQAIDRTHRIGQTRKVMVNRLVSANTIEEKVMALAERKGRLFDAVLGDDEQAFSRGLDADDIRALLEDA